LFIHNNLGSDQPIILMNLPSLYNSDNVLCTLEAKLSVSHILTPSCHILALHTNCSYQRVVARLTTVV